MNEAFQTTVDWFGKESPLRPEMSLQLTERQLHFCFRAHKAPHCDQSHKLGDFVEGLWQKDVAELFLAGQGKDYQEINISPTGAWWSAYFRDYRQFDRLVPFEPEIAVENSQSHWQIDFRAPLEAFVPWRGLCPHQFRLSVTAILYTPDAQYFAWNHSQGGEPDFHRFDLFQAL